MNTLYLITGNEGKAREYRAILGDRLEIKDFDLIEIQTLDAKELLTHKIKEAYKKVKSPVIVEDVSLEFEAIKPLPGPLIKWFLKSLGDVGLIRIIKDYENKRAKAICSIGYFDGKNLEVFEGIINGSILDAPIGDNGFGWDTVFLPDGSSKTYAQMSIDEKNLISHRALAIGKLKEYLDNM